MPNWSIVNIKIEKLNFDQNRDQCPFKSIPATICTFSLNYRNVLAITVNIIFLTLQTRCILNVTKNKIIMCFKYIRCKYALSDWHANHFTFSFKLERQFWAKNDFNCCSCTVAIAGVLLTQWARLKMINNIKKKLIWIIIMGWLE